jgi:hypothetical protein
MLNVKSERSSSEHTSIVGMLRLLLAIPKDDVPEDEAAAPADADDSCVVM